MIKSEIDKFFIDNEKQIFKLITNTKNFVFYHLPAYLTMEDIFSEFYCYLQATSYKYTTLTPAYLFYPDFIYYLYSKYKDTIKETKIINNMIKDLTKMFYSTDNFANVSLNVVEAAIQQLANNKYEAGRGKTLKEAKRILMGIEDEKGTV